MKLIGAQLKEYRISKKLVLQDISNDLNISLNILKAIESDEYDKTPGGVFTLGYIRSYAKYLNLDEDAVINEYKIQFNDINKKEDIKIQKPIESINNLNFIFNYRIISSISIVTLSITFYYMFINSNDNNLEYAMIPDITENMQIEIEEYEFKNALSQIKNANKNIQLEIIDNPDLKNSKINNSVNKLNASVPSKKIQNEINNLILVKSLESTWIQLRNIDNEIVYSRLLKPQEEYSYNINDNYNITTGNAGNLLISIGGIVKGKLGKKGEVIESLIITSDLF